MPFDTARIERTTGCEQCFDVVGSEQCAAAGICPMQHKHGIVDLALRVVVRLAKRSKV
jgi:hypothetical protein